MATFVLLHAGAAGAQQPRQPFVNRIVFEGNAYFSSSDLKKQIKTKETGFFSIFFKPRLDPEVLRRDIASLRGYYHANGFIDAEVELKHVRQLDNPAFVDVVISIVENEALRVVSIRFVGSGPIASATLAKAIVLRPGVAFARATLQADIFAIKRAYFENGHLAVAVADSTRIDGRKVGLWFGITPGPVLAINDISITGNDATKTSIVLKEFAFKSGEVFQLSRILETQRNLLETGLFTVADIEPVNLDTAKRTVDIVVRLRERKSAYVEAGFGVGNVHASRVFGEWGERNVFGTGRRLRFKVEYAFALFRQGASTQIENFDPRVNYYRYDLEFGQRRLFGTQLNLGLAGFVENDATVSNLDISTVGVSLNGNRRFSRYTNLLAGFSVNRIRREAPGFDTQHSNSHIITTVLNHDRRDFILDPTQGSYRDLILQLGGGLLGGDNDFYTISPTYQKYLRKIGFVFAVRGRIGFADSYGRSTAVPVENRYFAGGSQSVRGFPENSLGPTATSEVSPGVFDETAVGGRILLLGNVEWRFPLWRLSQYNFSGATFLDAGNVWASGKDITLSDFKIYKPHDEVTVNDFFYSVGLGIRYNTPVGPIRVDYGIPIKRQADLRFARFHVSLGQIF